MNIQREVKKEDVLSKISEIEIYRKYYPYKFEVGCRIRNPFVLKDEHPSMSVTEVGGGKIIFRCFNSQEKGDCLKFVQLITGLDYKATLSRIAQDFGLISSEGAFSGEILHPLETPKNGVKKQYVIGCIPKPYTQKHIDFLAKGFLEPKDLNFCGDTRAFALKEWWLNKKRQPLGNEEMAFYYELVNERGVWRKVYRPEKDKEHKWKSSIPFTEMHGLSNMKGCDLGIVTKSIKDGAFLAKYITPCVSVIQAEDMAALSKENIDFINNNCKTVYLALDADERGVSSSLEITKATGWKYINIPRRYLKFGATDFFDMCVYEQSPQAVIDYFKLKKVI